MTGKTHSTRAASSRDILLVDDHPFVRAGVRQIIESDPAFKVCAEASTIQEAMTAIGRVRPAAAVMDIGLSHGENGLDLIGRIRQAGHQFPILVLSMYEESLYAERALRAGAQGYLMKCAAPDQLISGLHRILGGYRFVSDKVTELMANRHNRPGPGSAKPSGLSKLSDRELAVYQLLGQGLRNPEIVQRMGINMKTLETHFERIKHKLDLRSAQDLRRHAFLSYQDENAGAADVSTPPSV